MYRTIFFLLFLLTGAKIVAQQNCSVTNHAISAGEQLDYKVVYNWGWIWLESAQASFKVSNAIHNKKNCYLFSGSGSTYPKHDWFFKVNDLFETYVDTLTFRPLKFRADINEGSKHDKHTYLFDDRERRSYTIISHGTKPVEVDTIPLETCSIDVLTAIYFARNLDYSKCKVNDTIGISVLMDGKLFPLYVRYLGREKYTSETLGSFNCVKFRPLLVEGSIFRKGEHMTVWVTDDENKLPLYIETAIIVGQIKVSLSSYKGLRHPLKARITLPSKAK
jgi:hypothetical protein